MQKIITAGAAVAGILWSGPAAAQAATRFNLICEGTRQTSISGPPAPHNYGFRIDLDAGRWCWETCERTYEFAEVGPDRLVFQKEDLDTRREQTSSENQVSRVTGEHHLIWLESRPSAIFMETKGTCRQAPFSGFPTVQF